MPGPIIHLRAAYYYNVRQNDKLSGEIYLGAVSPDSVNVGGFASKEKRWPAHLRDGNLRVWLNNAKEFYRANTGKTDEAFLRGYIIHIVTDIVWDARFNAELYERLMSDGVQKENLKAERWNELYGYEQTQVGKPWYNEVISELHSAKAIEIGTLKVNEIEDFQKTIILNRLNKGKSPKYINDELINRFLSEIFHILERLFL